MWRATSCRFSRASTYEHLATEALLIEENEPARMQTLRDHVERRGYRYVVSLEQNHLFVRLDEIELADRLNPDWSDIGPVLA